MATLDARIRGRPDPSHARGGLKLALRLDLTKRALPWLQAAAIILAAAIIFTPVLHGLWLWDDNTDITENDITQSPTGLWAIWFEPGTQLDYYPVKATVQWMQWQLWGLNTFGYHLTNLVLHILNALLAWRLFQKMGLRFAWLGGMIFAVHPTVVESVAWIAELKNTLSMPFFLLSAIFFLDYDAHGRRNDYAAALGFFVLAMLTKPTMVMFPVFLLVYAWWKRDGITLADLKAAAPFFTVSLIIGLITIMAGVWYGQLHHHENDFTVPWGGLLSRLAMAGLSLSFYLWKVIWPPPMLPIYPQWNINPPSLLQFWPWPVWAGAFLLLWSQRKTWGRHGLLGLGFFVLNLIPFIGLHAISFMNFTWVMDHFLYIPILGLIGLALAGLETAVPLMSAPVRRSGAVLIGLVLLAMIVESRVYAKKFISQEALWTYTLEINPDAWVANNNLGNIIVGEGRVDEGIAHFEAALATNPNFAEAHTNLGAALVKEGRIDEGIAQYDEALKINANYADAYYDYGNALSRAHRIPEAIERYAQAVELKPRFPEVHNNWGNALLEAGDAQDAIDHFAEAVRLKPDFAQAQNNWGNALMKLGQYQEAIGHYQEALALKADYSRAHYNLGNAMLLTGRYPEAIEQYQLSLAGDPNYVDAYYNMGNALIKQGRYAEAVGVFQQLLAIAPDDPRAHNNLGYALAQVGDAAGAIAQFQATLRLDPGDADAKRNIATLQAPGPKQAPRAKK